MDLQTAGLEYVLISGKPRLQAQALALHDQAFSFWKQFWTEVLVAVGVASPSLRGDDFLRHDLVANVLHRGTIVAQHAYTFFDLERAAARQHSFIASYFDEAAIAQVRRRGLRHVMSVEYLAVSPEWRYQRLGVSLASVVLSLACEVAAAAELDGMIAAARADVRVAKHCYELGAEPIRAGVLVHGKPTDILFWSCGALRPMPDAAVNALTAKLWSCRTDMTSLTTGRRQAAA